jgi:cytochrome bd ubiquinol oxidase subunit II
MDLPLLSALFAAFALSLYVMLDGFDLGVGTLLLVQPDERLRDQMVYSISTTWDGNETWLIMAGVTLLAGFPIAYGILLPAFYLPLAAMLLALGLRGVSFEFRFQADRGRRAWDIAFGVGSIIAALMQGLIVGGLIQGVAVNGEAFSGSVFDVFRPLCLLIAAAVLVGYVVLGAGWLHLKETAALQIFAERALRLATPAFVYLALAAIAAAALVQPRIQEVWIAHFQPLILIVVLFVIIAFLLMRAVGGPSDARPFALALALFALGVVGLGFVIFPDVVPFHFDLWAAAASSPSHVFLLTGALIVTPMVLSYTAFGYRVFRGTTPENGWE